MRADCYIEQLMLVINRTYQSIYPDSSDEIIQQKRQKITPNPTTKNLINFMSPLLSEIQMNTRDRGSNLSPALTVFNYSQEMCWAGIHSGLTRADGVSVNFPLHSGLHPKASGSCLATYRSEELNQLKSQLEM